MAAWFGGQWAVERMIQGPLEEERRVTERLKDDIKQREEGLARIREAGKLLDIWQDQSLPSDPEVARSLYQAWLIELIDDIGLASPSVTSSEPVLRHLLFACVFRARSRNARSADGVPVRRLPDGPAASDPSQYS